MSLILYLQCCDGSLEQLIFSGLTSFGTCIEKDVGHRLFNGKEVHKFGSRCCRVETALTKKFGGKSKEVILLFGLITRHN